MRLRDAYPSRCPNPPRSCASTNRRASPRRCLPECPRGLPPPGSFLRPPPRRWHPPHPPRAPRLCGQERGFQPQPAPSFPPCAKHKRHPRCDWQAGSYVQPSSFHIHGSNLLRIVRSAGLLLRRRIGAAFGEGFLLLVPLGGQIIVIGRHRIELAHHVIALLGQFLHLVVLLFDVLVLLFDALVSGLQCLFVNLALPEIFVSLRLRFFQVLGEP